MSSRRSNRVAYRKSAAIIRASEVLNNVSQISFLKWTIAWIVSVSLISACFLMHFEGKNDNNKNDLTWEDAIFLSAGGVTATGLNSFDITMFSRASLNTIMIATQLGSATLTSLVPVVIRIRYLRQVIPRNYRTFNLNNFKRVPEWLVEYKALVYLARIVIFTNLLVYLVYGGLLYYSLTSSDDSMAVLSDPDNNTAAAANTPGYWTLFHTISAYNNCGYSLQRDSFASFDSNVGILYSLNMLVLHGNVLHPIILRWIIIGLSAFTPKSRSSKVYFRYLLLNGRHLYSNLFGSQQTWLLLLQQLLLVTIQVIFTVWLTPRHPTFNVALFEAVNVRHAGFNAIPLPDLSSGILIMFVSFMYLAPMPYIAMLKASMCAAPTIDSIIGLSVGGFEDSATLLATPSTSTGVHSNVTQNTQNSRKLSLNMARDNLRENLARMGTDEGGTRGSTQLWNEKATMRSELSSVTRKSIKDKVVINEMLDTRLLILTMYSESQHVPWKDRITLRVKAVTYQAKRLWRSFCSGIKPDMFLIWFVWWIICSWEEFSAESPAVFNTLFEIVSSFGNVGLSLGSFSDQSSPCSFAMDLSWYSKMLLVAVQIAGRTRDLPSKVDSVLTVTKPVDAKEILTERWLHFSTQHSPEAGYSDGEGGEGGEEVDKDRSFVSTGSSVSFRTGGSEAQERAAREEEEGTQAKKIDDDEEGEGGVKKIMRKKSQRGGKEEEDNNLSVPLLRDFNGVKNAVPVSESRRGSRVTFSEVER